MPMAPCRGCGRDKDAGERCPVCSEDRLFAPADPDSCGVRGPILRDEIASMKAQCAAARRDVARAFRTPPTRPPWQEADERRDEPQAGVAAAREAMVANLAKLRAGGVVVLPAESGRAPLRLPRALAYVALGWLAGLALALAGAWISRGGFAP